ncbi:cyanase [Pseudonocardia eucalypti]|uniref:Cyanate hydratase n=1 Tax=Pseudonocardia eucalypti TaxID=648755 RepID=A0ABP9PUJ4_9PSEU|nr:cyanate lyase [Pseudonocardia eucalypti]
MTFTPLPNLNRRDAATAVLAAKRRLGLTWAAIAERLERSTEWTTSALLGQQPLTEEQVKTVRALLDLDEAVAEALLLPPLRGAGAVDTSEPIVYRLQEAIQVYGTAISELIREEFGDGIMSAIDFELALERVPDPKGDRVKLTLNGKFLPYRVW